MMRLTMLIVMATSITSPVWALPIPVTSGEHTGYTRIVFDLGVDVDWSHSTTPDTVSLLLFEPLVEFDDLSVFDRISRDRVLQTTYMIERDQMIYTIELNCNCTVEVFPYLERYVVIDVRDEVAGVLPDIDETQVVNNLEMPDVPMHPLSVGNFGDFPFDETSVAATSDAMEFDDVTLSEVRESLISQLTTAAEQGLIEFEEVTPVLNDDDGGPTVGVDFIELEVSEIPEAIQWRIQTAMDRDANQRQPIGNLLNTCPDAAQLDIVNWAEGNNFTTEISNARAAYLQEFDQVDGEKLENLVHVYLYYGFGAEATTYLREYGETIPNNQLLSEIAIIVDGGQVSDNGVLTSATSCGGTIGLLSIVGTYPDISGPIDNVDSVIAKFVQMPIAMRKLFGNRLAQSFIDRDQLSRGQEVYDIIDRAPGDLGGVYALVQAELLLSAGDKNAAATIFKNASTQTSETSTQALISLAVQLLENGKMPSEGQIIDLGGIADQLRGTAEGLHVRRLELEFVAMGLGEYTAISRISQEVELNPEQTEKLEQIGFLLLDNMDPEPHGISNYIQTIQKFEDLIPDNALGDDTRQKIAENLINYGFPNFALDILQDRIMMNDASNVALAEVYLMQNRPEKAAEVLNGMQAQTDSEIFVKVDLELGNFEGALDILKMNGDLQVDPSWYPGNWREAADESAAAAEIQRLYLQKHLIDVQIDGQTVPNVGLTMLSEFQDVLSNSDAVMKSLGSELNQ